MSEEDAGFLDRSRRTNLGAMADVEGEGRNGGEYGRYGRNDQSSLPCAVYSRIRFSGG